jgi:hypothetical protein
MSRPPARRLFAVRLVLISAGGAALAYAVLGVVMSHDTRLAYLRFVTLAPVGHELVLMPLALALGVLIGRFIPTTARPVVQAAIFISAVITAVALPGALGYGRSADLPSALPRDYLSGLAIILALIWGAAAAIILVRWRRGKAQANG